MTDRPDWRYHALFNHQQNHEDVPVHDCPEASCREFTAFEAIGIAGEPPQPDCGKPGCSVTVPHNHEGPWT